MWTGFGAQATALGRFLGATLSFRPDEWRRCTGGRPSSGARRAARRLGSRRPGGPSGTGKPELMHHIARRMGRPVMVRRGSDIESPWVGLSEKNVAAAFAVLFPTLFHRPSVTIIHRPEVTPSPFC